MSRVAAAFQVAVTRVPGSSPSRSAESRLTSAASG